MELQLVVAVVDLKEVRWETATGFAMVDLLVKRKVAEMACAVADCLVDIKV